MYSFKRQKKTLVSFSLIPDSHSIKIYISNPYLEWRRLQVIDLFLVSFLSIETNPNNNKNIAWIKGDIYDCWYCVFNILKSSFIIKVIILIVDKKVTTATAQKDKEILSEIVDKVQEETFWPTMMKLLRTYMTFVMDSPDFS